MAERVAIPVGEGGQLEALLDFPPTAGPVPGLILAPGSSYPKEGPLIAALSAHALGAGWATLRFDWRYTTGGSRPSSNRSREVEDLEAALDYARALPRLAGPPLVLAGKSLGAAVAYRVFRSRPEVAAAALLTPVFRDPAGAEKHFPGLRDERRPVLLLAGNRDPLNVRPVMETHLQGFFGRNAKPAEQAWPLAFLSSELASFISGVNLCVDAGYSGALLTGTIDPPPPPRVAGR